MSGDHAAQTGARVVRAFARDLHRGFSGGGNSVMSPWSVVAALGMCRAGAVGETADEVDRVLHSSGVDLPTCLAALDSHLTGLAGPVHDEAGGEGTISLRQANSLWLQRGFELCEPFVETLVERWGAALHDADFAGAPDGGREAINAWVAERTAGKITDLLPPDSLDTLTRLVLANAVHLLAPWAVKFRTGADEAFHLLDGRVASVPFMASQHRRPLRSGDGWLSVTVPYAGWSLALTIVLPGPGRFGDVDREADLDAWLAPVDERPVLLRMPGFEVSTGADLVPVLAALGMPTAFDPDRADFSAMTGEEPLHVSTVAHRATIAVDEDGTEAAAATAVVMAARAAIVRPDPPVEVVVDRPFLFVLHDVSHATPLFVGKVTDPRPAGEGRLRGGDPRG